MTTSGSAKLAALANPIPTVTIFPENPSEALSLKKSNQGSSLLDYRKKSIVV